MITFIANDGGDPTTVASSPANGSTVTLGGQQFTLQYNGGDGNDVVLVAPAAVSTTVNLDGGGNLIVTDTGNKADLIVSRSGANIRVQDPANPLTAGRGRRRSMQTRSKIAFASVTGNLALNTGNGADTVTLDFGGGNPIPGGGMNYAGGLPPAAPGDKLMLQNGTFATAGFSFTNATDGSDPARSRRPRRHRRFDDHLHRPRSDQLDAHRRRRDAQLQRRRRDDHRPAVRGCHDADRGDFRRAAESLDFANPTVSLTINMGQTGNDTVNVNGFGTGFRASFKIDDQDRTGADVVNLNTAIALGLDDGIWQHRSAGGHDPRLWRPAHRQRANERRGRGALARHDGAPQQRHLDRHRRPAGRRQRDFLGDVVTDSNAGANNRR